MPILTVPIIVFFIVYLGLRYLERRQPNHKIFIIHKSLHWFYQIIPPLLLLLLFTRQGPGLWFATAVVFMLGFISIISILVMVFRFRKNKRFLLRPILTSVVAFSFYALATSSLKEAKEQAVTIAKNIEALCIKDNVCPQSIEHPKVGHFVSYPIRYVNSGSDFTLYLIQSLDWGTRYSSGVSGDFQTRSM